MDFVKAYTFIWKEPGWVGKIAGAALASFFSFLILPIFLLMGYQIGVVRNVSEGREQVLPEWVDFGKLFMDGLYIAIAAFVYSLPVWLLSCFGTLISFFTSSDGGAVSDIGAVFYILISCLSALVGIALAFVTPAITIQYVRTNDFGALFRFGEVIQIARDNLADIFLTIVAAIGAAIVFMVVIVVSVITICGPIILAFVGPVWLTLGTGHLYGQILAKSKGKMAAGTVM